MARERTQKDYDIIRQSSLKAAVELTVVSHDFNSKEDELITSTIRMAEKFVSWILHDEDDLRDNPELGQPVRDWHAKILKECHKLQKKLNMDLTNFGSDPCPYGNWHNGGAEMLLDSLRDLLNGNRDGNKPGYQHNNGPDRKTQFRPGEKDENGLDREDSWAGANFPLTKKQYGFLVSLHKRNKMKYKNDDLNNLTQRQASELIDELIGDDNGDGDSGYGGTSLP